MEIGSVIDGRYVVKGLIGRGGMGEVYLVKSIKLESLWAMKKISKDSRLKSNYKIELDLLKKLNHLALPRIYDFYEDDSYLYIFLDYFEGITLEKKLEERSLNIEKAIDIIKQLSDVLLYLHEHKPNPIIYRDIKPSNIILLSNGNVKLIDFGISREFKIDSGSDTVYIGTKGYAAPEQYGFGQTDARTDIFSLGIIFCQMVTEISPQSENFILRENMFMNRNVPKEIQDIIKKAVQKKPEDRYQKIRELIYDLNSFDKMLNTTNEKTKKVMYIPNDYKKSILILGPEGVGTSTNAISIAESLSQRKKRVGVVDLTHDNKLYKRIGKRYDKMYPGKIEKAYDGITNLLTGNLAPVMADNDIMFFLQVGERVLTDEEFLHITDILKTACDVIIFQGDINTKSNVFRFVDGIFIVKDMNAYNCEAINEYLKNNIKTEAYKNKLKFIINKTFKSAIEPEDIVNTCCEGIWEDGEINFYEIQFELENMRLALENEKYEGFTCNNFTKSFRKSIDKIARDIYPSSEKGYIRP